MPVNLRVTPLLFVMLLLTSCASSYKPISPQTLEYHNQSINDGIEFSYHHSVLIESRNKKYAKHETKNHISLVAVKITNMTGREINPMTDAVFYINKKTAYPVDQKLSADKIKQGVPVYLLYLLLTPMTFNTNSSSDMYAQQHSSSFPLGLIVGPGITGLNMIIAGSANKQFKEELETNSLYRQLPNGETMYALVAFQDIGMDEITMKLK
jgi:hypothetical protein